MSTSSICDRIKYLPEEGGFVSCEGRLTAQLIENECGQFPTHRVCPVCGKDFGEVDLFSSPLDLTSSHKQQLLNFR